MRSPRVSGYRRGCRHLSVLRPLLGLLLIGATLDLCAPAVAEVRVERLPDGTILLVGDGSRPGRRWPTKAVRPRMPGPEIDALIEDHSKRQDLEPGLVRAVIQAESDYDPRAVSKKGAIGLMQLMPETARDLGISDPWDPEENIRGGTRYLRLMLDRFDQDLELALAGYNAGPGAVERHEGVPPYPETTAYVDKVLMLFDGRRNVRAGRVGSRSRSAYRSVSVKRLDDGTVLLVTP